MGEREQILTEIHAIIERVGAAVSISPTTIALELDRLYRADAQIDARLQYGAQEHFKQLARGALSGRFDPVQQAEEEQGDLFSVHLQPRYPTPHKRGEDPVYKLRSELTPFERAWNVKRMRKAAGALQMHADALEAEGQSQKAA